MLKIKTTVPAKVVMPQEEIGVGKVETKKQGPHVKIGAIPSKEHRDPNVIYINSTPDTSPKKPGRTIVIKGESYPLRAPSNLENRCEELFHSMLGRSCSPNAESKSLSFFSYSNMGAYKVVASGSGEHGRKSLA